MPGQLVAVDTEHRGATLAKAVHLSRGVVVHHDCVTHNTALSVPELPNIDVAQAARYLGLSQRSVRRLVAARAIGHRRPLGLIRFTQRDLDQYIEGVSVAPKVSEVH
jgi:excisionase family DNA binding protein